MNEINYYYRWLNVPDYKRPTIVCLHGFTGTGQTFAGLFNDNKYNFLLVDLIGHGKSSVYVHPTYYQMDNVIDALKELMIKLKIKNYYVLGYSMGGRVAIAWAINDVKVKGLILESTRPGIADEDVRKKRRLKDNQLVARILTQPLADFVNYWERIPLFASQQGLPQEVRKSIREQRLNQKAYGLAMSLMMMGTGQQENYWNRLPQQIPILLIVGELDEKFKKIAYKMCQKARQIDLRILSGGHCVHLESPEQFEKTVLEWLKRNCDRR